MKSLPLSNPNFRYLEKSFSEWLDVLGYSQQSIYQMPIHVRELLHYLETQQLSNINTLTPQHIKNHYKKLQERSNKTRGGGLSKSHLNKHIQAIRKFTDYLRQVGRLEIGDLQLKNEEKESKAIEIVTEEEIQQLIKSSYQVEVPKYKSELLIKCIDARDRAMISILYGCGLRRNEAVQTNVNDIDFDKRVIHVRKGKNYKERLVPIGKQIFKYLQEWVYDYRRELLATRKIDALFISERGTRLQGQSMLLRLKVLQSRTGNTKLQEKEIGLHTLRHSIATHLLDHGMSLEDISRFLGHSSLESTQIYTHILSGCHGEPVEPQPLKQNYPNIPNYETIQLSEDEL